MKNLTYDDIVTRLGYFRAKANLSLRETSLRLGYNPQFMKTIENKSIELKVRTLIDFCEIVDIDIYDFFYMGKNYNKEDKEILELFNSLTNDNKAIILQLMKNLK